MTMSLQVVEAFASPELRHEGRVEFHRRGWCEHRDLTLYLSIANLSFGGMFIQTSTPLLRGERLRVCVQDRPRITLDAEIVWCSRRLRHAGVGCRVLAIVEGEEFYRALIEQLSENGR